jgi:hypothetical protein
MSWTNHDAIHRHACHALEDFRQLRQQRHGRGNDHELWHSLSHHLRHVVFRSGHETPHKRTDCVRRSHVGRAHK